MNPPAELLARWRNDPLAFAGDVGLPPTREWQDDALRDIAEYQFNAIAGCRKASKTNTAARAAIWFKCSRPRSTVILAAPRLRQLRVWAEVRALWRQSRLPSLFPGWLLQKYELVQSELPTAGIGCVSDELGEYAEGAAGEQTLLIFDEAKHVSESFARSLLPMIAGDPDAGVLAISTPLGRTGFFFSCLTDPEYKVRFVSALDIPRLAPWAKEQVAKYGLVHPYVQRQVLGRPSDSGETDSLLPTAAVFAAAARLPFPLDPWRPTPAGLGWDPAGRGRDYSVACYRRGRNFGPLYTVGHGSDEMATVGKIIQLADRLHVQTISIDAIGLGGPLASRLEELYDDPTRRRVRVVRFNASSRARDSENYANAKTEILFSLRKALEDGTISLAPANDRELLAQLSAFGLVTASNGRVRSVDPPRSPDKADALILAAYAGRGEADAIDPYVEVATARPAVLGY